MQRRNPFVVIQIGIIAPVPTNDPSIFPSSKKEVQEETSVIHVSFISDIYYTIGII